MKFHQNPLSSNCPNIQLSQEECTRLREGVPYVKVFDITQNTYVQS
jgi:hypothetical protein